MENKLTILIVGSTEFWKNDCLHPVLVEMDSGMVYCNMFVLIAEYLWW